MGMATFVTENKKSLTLSNEKTLKLENRNQIKKEFVDQADPESSLSNQEKDVEEDSKGLDIKNKLPAMTVMEKLIIGYYLFVESTYYISSKRKKKNPVIIIFDVTLEILLSTSKMNYILDRSCLNRTWVWVVFYPSFMIQNTLLLMY